MNGATALTAPLVEREAWGGGFGYGEPPYADTNQGEETPRHSSALVVAASHVPPYEHDQTIEPDVGTADALSDRTLLLDISSRHGSD